MALPVGDRLLRAVEKWLLPWWNRGKAEAAASRAARAVAREERKAQRNETIRLDAEAARSEWSAAVASYARVRIRR